MSLSFLAWRTALWVAFLPSKLSTTFSMFSLRYTAASLLRARQFVVRVKVMFLPSSSPLILAYFGVFDNFFNRVEIEKRLASEKVGFKISPSPAVFNEEIYRLLAHLGGHILRLGVVSAASREAVVAPHIAVVADVKAKRLYKRGVFPEFPFRFGGIKRAFGYQGVEFCVDIGTLSSSSAASDVYKRQP